MQKTMERWNDLDPATGTRNYMGADMSDYFVLYSQSRDDDVLARSNFRAIYADIEPLNTLLDGEDTIRIERFNHWACGWYELILIHESNAAAIQRGNEIIARLDAYPVFDEEDFSTLEYEEAEELWKSLSVRERAELIRDANNGVSIFAARRPWIPETDDGGILERLTII